MDRQPSKVTKRAGWTVVAISVPALVVVGVLRFNHAIGEELFATLFAALIASTLSGGFAVARGKSGGNG